jgi:hypothetical protein
MANKPTDKKTRFVVSFTKEVCYPSGMLERGNKIADAYNKALGDLGDNLRKLIHEDLPLDQIFSINVAEVANYKRKTDVGAIPRQTTGLGAVIRGLAQVDTVNKYGELNSEVNPKIFTIEPALTDAAGNTLRESFTFLKPEVEQFMLDREIWYRDIIVRIQDGNL